MKKIKDINIDVFRANLKIFKGYNRDEFQKYMLSNFGFEQNINGYDGATIALESDESRFLVIIWINNLNILEITHESIHAANMILNHIGHKINDITNDEIQAYLSGYIAKIIYE